MLIKTIIFLVVFAAVFYLARRLYPFLEGFLGRWERKRADKIKPQLNHMFIDVPLKKIMLLDIFFPALCALAAYAFSRNLLLAIGAAGIGLFIPFLMLRQLKLKRRQKFASQLVDGLMIISSSLKAGLSLSQSFEALVEEMPAPIAQEFSLVVRQIRMGVALDAAMYNMKKRMRLDELDMVITAMMVARETGGDLTATFSRVVYTIQERNKLIGRVKALCVQAKLQGAIMSVLPILFAVFVYKVNPGFFDIFLRDSFGRMLLAYAVISEIVGIIFIHKLSKIDI